MAEVLFYERPVPLNRDEHKNLLLKGLPTTRFAMNTHSVPLTGPEFAMAARDMMVLFAGTSADDCGPIALLGLRKDENLFVDETGRWDPNAYVPAFVRRYPFVLAERPQGQPEGEDYTVFLDEAYEGFNTVEGERLFKEDGTDSQLLANAVKFLSEFQQNIVNTRQFMKRLNEANLLEPRNIRLQKGEEGDSINLQGLFVVSEEKLRTLDEKTAHEFARDGVFGWIYAHLLSLSNIDRLTRRLDGRLQANAGTVQ